MTGAPRLVAGSKEARDPGTHPPRQGRAKGALHREGGQVKEGRDQRRRTTVPTETNQWRPTS